MPLLTRRLSFRSKQNPTSAGLPPRQPNRSSFKKSARLKRLLSLRIFPAAKERLSPAQFSASSAGQFLSISAAPRELGPTRNQPQASATSRASGFALIFQESKKARAEFSCGYRVLTRCFLKNYSRLRLRRWRAGSRKSRGWLARDAPVPRGQ